MKSIEIEFEAGQNVEIMKGSQPMSTRIRAIHFDASLEITRDAKTGAETERIVERVSYSTFADPNTPLPGSKIGVTKEDLMKKVFGVAATSGSDENKPSQKK